MNPNKVLSLPPLYFFTVPAYATSSLMMLIFSVNYFKMDLVAITDHKKQILTFSMCMLACFYIHVRATLHSYMKNLVFINISFSYRSKYIHEFMYARIRICASMYLCTSSIFKYICCLSLTYFFVLVLLLFNMCIFFNKNLFVFSIYRI